MIAAISLPVSAYGEELVLTAEGTWGRSDLSPLGCSINPHVITFDKANRRMVFKWAKPVATDLGPQDVIYYGIVGSGGQGPVKDLLVLGRESDKRLFVMDFSDARNAYRWGTPETELEQFSDEFVRCDVVIS